MSNDRQQGSPNGPGMSEGPAASHTSPDGGEQESLFGYQTQPGGHRIGNGVPRNQASAKNVSHGGPRSFESGSNGMYAGPANPSGPSQPHYGNPPAQYDSPQGQPRGYDTQTGGYDSQQGSHGGYLAPPGGHQGGYGPGQGAYGVAQPYRSKTNAALLAFFFGTLGAHNFYLGRKNLGLVHVGLVVLGMVLMFGGAYAASSSGDPNSPLLGIVVLSFAMIIGNIVWAFVEFIMILFTPEHQLGR